MINCPYCNEAVNLNTAEYNVEAYGGSVRVAAPCCGKPIGIRRILILDHFKATDSRDEDDWGVPYNKADKDLVN